MHCVRFEGSMELLCDWLVFDISDLVWSLFYGKLHLIDPLFQQKKSVRLFHIWFQIAGPKDGLIFHKNLLFDS